MAEATGKRQKSASSLRERGAEWLESAREWLLRVAGLRQQSRPGSQVGIVLRPEGISLASVQRQAGSTPRVTRLEFVPLGRQADPGLALRNIAQQSAEERVNFHLVLNPDEYQLHLVETPDVPDSELREAVRWRVRDLIDFPVDEAAIDVFDMPQQAGTGRDATKMMNVVVSRTPLIAEKAALVNRSGGELEVIDIPDLVLRNLMALTPENRTGTALLYVEQDFSLILITSESTVFLSRRVFIGRSDLSAISGREEQDEEFKRRAGAIALEVLRSLEYYESHFARPQVEALYIAPTGVADPTLQQHLGRALNVSVRDLDLTDLVDIEGGMTPEQQARGLLAIGMALRQDRTLL